MMIPDPTIIVNDLGHTSPISTPMAPVCAWNSEISMEVDPEMTGFGETSTLPIFEKLFPVIRKYFYSRLVGSKVSFRSRKNFSSFPSLRN